MNNSPPPMMVMMPTLESRDTWKTQKLNPILTMETSMTHNPTDALPDGSLCACQDKAA